jgi:pyrophosphate--fructose-6-phosphate 1-phosphotransferase
VEVIVQRAENKMDFGIILVPEGLIEFIPEVSRLIKEIN